MSPLPAQSSNTPRTPLSEDTVLSNGVTQDPLDRQDLPPGLVCLGMIGNSSFTTSPDTPNDQAESDAPFARDADTFRSTAETTTHREASGRDSISYRVVSLWHVLITTTPIALIDVAVFAAVLWTTNQIVGIAADAIQGSLFQSWLGLQNMTVPPALIGTQGPESLQDLPATMDIMSVGICSLTVYALIAAPRGLFRIAAVNPIKELRVGVQASCLATIFAIAFVEGSRLPFALCVLAASVASTLFLFLGPLGRIIGRAGMAQFRWWGIPAIVIGDGPRSRMLFEHFARCRTRGVRVVGIVRPFRAFALVDREGHTRGTSPSVGGIQSLAAVTRKHGVRLAILAVEDPRSVDAARLTREVHDWIPEVQIPVGEDLPSLHSNIDDLAGFASIRCRDRLRRPFAILFKRCTDLVFASALILILAPALLLVALMVKFFSPGPVFYGHTRIGRNGKTFKAWKFRTMVADADAKLKAVLDSDPELRRSWERDQKLPHDPRIIPRIGNVLRKTSFDEIPQLWNVIKGEMSLVGPRPIVADEIARYDKEFASYLQVRPGITGLWQVSGRNDTTYPQRVALDSYYVRNWSFCLDFYLLIRTFRTTALGEGAY
ncbi:MAG: exopolysaccharide biosynthesis polyprenyl glycosylphosphotransferase [Planctomycetota bacterium]